MRKLLRANLSRLIKSRALHLCMAAAFLLSVLFLINLRADNEDLTVLDEIIVQVLPFLPIFYAVFASLFLGVEYQDNTMRNKIIAGHSRAAVYAANLIAVTIGCLAIMLSWLATAAIGAIKFGGFVQSADALLLQFVIIALLTAAISAILTIIGMLMSNRAVSAVAAILLVFGLIALGSAIYGALSEPETTTPVVMTQNGVEFGDPAPNPAYVSGARRMLYQFAVDALPTGQSILIANQELARPVLSACASIGIYLLVSAAGIAIFKRRDLK